MNVYSKSILSNEKLSTVKKEYEEKFKEIQKYIYLIRKINNFNTTNMCPVCFSNQVDHFIAPCGHTYCKTCLETLIRSEDIYNINHEMMIIVRFVATNQNSSSIVFSINFSIILLKILF